MKETGARIVARTPILAMCFSTSYLLSKPHAAAAKVAHPLMLRAIAASKKKNDSIDAGKHRRLPALRFSS